MSHDDRAEFAEQNRTAAIAMGKDPEIVAAARDLVDKSDMYDWNYQWTWLGLPVIQLPSDIVVMQEIIWANKPDLIIETGVARGGSMTLYGSILQMIGDGTVIGIDIDIRAHNREALEAHPLSHRWELIESSSTDMDTVTYVRARAAQASRVMVILDSNHTHEHVLAELEAYGDLVSPGQFLVVADTEVEYLPVKDHRPRPWAPGDNPLTALNAWISGHDDFVADEYVNAKLLVTTSRGGYLRRRPVAIA